MLKLQSSQLSIVETREEPEFEAHPLFFNGDLMTIAPLFVYRSFKRFKQRGSQRIFQISADTGVLAGCHFHADAIRRFTVLLVHGLEGSSDAPPMLGIAEKAFNNGMNVVRMNLRNCGGSMNMTPGLYNAGLASDVVSICRQLESEGLRRILLCGYSLGGNIVLNAAVSGGEGIIKAVAAVSPSIDLPRCVDSLERPRNAIYQHWFLSSLKSKVRQKALLYPGIYDCSALQRIRTMRHFDNEYTAPHGGYGTAENYYQTASASRSLSDLRVPALIIASQDDPIVPFDSFSGDWSGNSLIRLLATKTGGHAGFVAARKENNTWFDEYWAENRVVSFFGEVISNLQ